LAERGVALAVKDAALDLVLEEAYDPVYGARPLRRWLEKKVVTQLSKMLIRGEIDENSTLFIDVKKTLTGKKELSYHVENNGGLVNSETGVKSDILIHVPDRPRENVKEVKRMKIQALDEDEDEEMED
jgi:ATP-dependent Clp protease ATP-binding subunit ClpB